MDPKHTGNVLKHLEKQNELLMEAYRSMSHELHALQVEEEMLMHKYYELMVAQGVIEKEKNTSGTNATANDETGQAGALVSVTEENDETGQANALVSVTEENDETGQAGTLVSVTEEQQPEGSQ